MPFVYYKVATWEVEQSPREVTSDKKYITKELWG